MTTASWVRTDDYFVGAVIGEGSFGRVVHGRHKVDGRDVAIKVVDKHSLVRNPAWRDSVLQEQRLLRELRSCNRIVQLYSSFHDAECLYLVLECCRGGDLQGLLRQQQLHTGMLVCVDTQWQRSVSYYAREIWMALAFLHDREIVHADVKPSNILLTERGEVRLADFGAAVDLARNRNKKESTGDQPVCYQGSTSYASPEIIRGNPLCRLTIAVDLWSYGCLVYAMFAGESPFTAETGLLVVERVGRYIKSDLEVKKEYFRYLPEIWKSLVLSLLEPSAELRIKAPTTANLNDASCDLWREATLNFKNLCLPAKPNWLQYTNTMKDGKLGWSVFLV